MKSSGKGASLPVEALRGEAGGRAHLQGTLRVIQKEGFGNGHLSPYGVRWGI